MRLARFFGLVRLLSLRLRSAEQRAQHIKNTGILGLRRPWHHAAHQHEHKNKQAGTQIYHAASLAEHQDCEQFRATCA